MRRLFLFFACILFAGCTSTKFPRETLQKKEKISALIETMTVREKIGQMIAVVPENFDFTLTQEQIDQGRIPSSVTVSEKMKENFIRYPAGTIILFGKNLDTPEQTEKLMDDFKSLSKIPLMVSVDEEGGRVARIAKNETFEVENLPPALETQTEKKAFENSFYIGSYLSKYGFTADFAPVADIWTNEENTVIGNRAFSKEPKTAAKMVKASIKGFHKAKMLTSIKHFPGHGDTTADSHTGSAVSLKTWEELQACEMIPFKAGIEAGSDMVMIAHIRTPNAKTEDLPATLSKTWITDRLRGELGFNGVVITDAMGMKAVSNYFESTESALMAIKAGCDIILMPHDYAKTFDYLVSCVENGTIPMERINESIERILKMKL
ncbi:MAG: glycoside hydrolase family 3 protein [Spirochaetales bacterium]|nr:glycoside hydrolase family 3 protein [Spirochaetales bacterium]